MLGLRSKLTLAFGGMLAILMVVGALSSLLLSKYGSTIEKLLHENYNSVVYAQAMKDAVDDLDDLAQASLWTSNSDAAEQSEKEIFQRFEENYAKEKGNLTLSDEGVVASELGQQWQLYLQDYKTFTANKLEAGDRQQMYLSLLAPGARKLDHLAQRVVDMNLANIVSVDGQVQENTILARKAMFGLVISGIVLAILIITLLGRSIIQPIVILTKSVREVEKGNLDLAVTVSSRDELGQLAEAFNGMASRLREYRRSDRVKLIRTQKTTQLAVDTFPDGVAIIGLDGKVELANKIAQKHFALQPGIDLASSPLKTVWKLFEQVFASLEPVHPHAYDTAVQIFNNDQEIFYLPQAVPIMDEEKNLLGVTIVLSDVTDLRRLDEMKSSLLAVVSHELKTPLTSIRMATHLLLDERLGFLNDKQSDLLVAARDDAEKLNAIIEKLLDIGRIESGRELMEMKPIDPEHLISGAIESFQTAYRDRGVSLNMRLAEDLPRVAADRSRIEHVFSNLLSNSLKYTPSGGSVTISAFPVDKMVAFEVRDTGPGISKDALPRVFERFYRAPGQGEIKGAGLGLAIAREIVEAHGGSIEVTSEVNKGCHFTFRLRIWDAANPIEKDKGESFG